MNETVRRAIIDGVLAYLEEWDDTDEQVGVAEREFRYAAEGNHFPALSGPQWLTVCGTLLEPSYRKGPKT